MPRMIRMIGAVCLSFLLGLAHAQDGEPVEADATDRAARLSLVEGDVSLHPVGEPAAVPALLNRPLLSGDSLSTDAAARAELQVGHAAVRLGPDTRFSFLNLDQDSIQMHLTEGVISIHVRALGETDRIDIDTPNLTLQLVHPGSYRVEVDAASETTIVKVRDGEANAHAPSQNVIVRTGQVVTFSGVDPLTALFDALPEPDGFDAWTGERERRDFLASTSRSAQYVSPDVTGYADLDDHGTWSAEPGYGHVWTPSHVGAGWSPYSHGSWSWVSPWGWTWIDAAPWGYAPFHYGRWAHVRDRWCWVPGPRHERAGRAPAIVHSVVQEVRDSRARSSTFPYRAVPASETALPRVTSARAPAQPRADAREIVRQIPAQRAARESGNLQVPRVQPPRQTTGAPRASPRDQRPRPERAPARPAVQPSQTPRPASRPVPSSTVKSVVEQVRAKRGGR